MKNVGEKPDYKINLSPQQAAYLRIIHVCSTKLILVEYLEICINH